MCCKLFPYRSLLSKESNLPGESLGNYEDASVSLDESSMKPKISSKVDFLKLSREKGYVAARTYIKKIQIAEHIENTKVQEDKTVSSRAYL